MILHYLIQLIKVFLYNAVRHNSLFLIHQCSLFLLFVLCYLFQFSLVSTTYSILISFFSISDYLPAYTDYIDWYIFPLFLLSALLPCLTIVLCFYVLLSHVHNNKSSMLTTTQLVGGKQ